MVLPSPLGTPRRLLPALFVLVVWATTLPAQDADPRVPVPDEAAQKQALAILREVYEKEYEGAKTSTQKLALAKKLLAKAGESPDDSADHFVLLRVARDMAAEAGEVGTTLEAIDRMAEFFQVDGLPMKVSAIVKLGKSARSETQKKALAAGALDLVDEAVAGDHYDVANQLLKVADTATRKIRAGTLAKQVKARRKEVAGIAAAYAEVQPVLARLDKEPTDPEANLAAGKFFCLVKGDWEKGVHMLALGNDATLKALAVKELKGINSPAEQVKLGDGWWALAEQRKDAHKQQLQAHAADWYRLAVGKLTGLAKSKVEKRLDSLTANTAAVKPKLTIPVAITILQAVFGTKTKQIDVTSVLQEAVDKDRFAPIQADHRAFGDPAPKKRKRLLVAYRVGRRRMTMNLAEGTPAIIPPIPREGIKLREASKEFTVVAARFGARLNWLDVTSMVAELASDPTKPLTFGQTQLGYNPQPEVHKFVVVWFDYLGKRYVRVFKDGAATVLLP